MVEGIIRPPKEGEKYFPLVKVSKINGRDAAFVRDRVPFEHLTPLFPDEKFRLCKGGYSDSMSARVVDLFAPIGKGQRADVIIKAAKVLGKRKDYRIHMLGDGRMREELEQMVRAEGLEENVIFYGNQKREDMPKFYKMADVLLVTLRGNNEVGDTIPGKMQMYMTTSKTIFGAINGGAQEVIRESRCGSCVPAGDYEGLAKLMQLYIEHPHDYDQCGENAREYFKAHFTLEHYMNGLEAELQKVVDSKR